MAKVLRRDREDEDGPAGHGPGDGRVQLRMVVKYSGGVDG